MDIMSKKNWNTMSDDAKVKHLLRHDIIYKTMPILNEDGGTRGIGFQYQCLLGGVMMSGWHVSKQEAAQEAVENTASFVSSIIHKRAGVFFNRSSAYINGEDRAKKNIV